MRGKGLDLSCRLGFDQKGCTKAANKYAIITISDKSIQIELIQDYLFSNVQRVFTMGHQKTRMKNPSGLARGVQSQQALPAMTNLLSDMELFFNVLGHDFTIEEVDDAVSVISVIRRVSYHDDGCSFLV